jgi:hypothetical protein
VIELVDLLVGNPTGSLRRSTVRVLQHLTIRRLVEEAETLPHHLDVALEAKASLQGGDETKLARRERDVSVSTLIDGVPFMLSDGFPVSVSRTLYRRTGTVGGKRYRPAAR